jgi:hypothetical protein
MGTPETDSRELKGLHENLKRKRLDLSAPVDGGPRNCRSLHYATLRSG